MDNATLNTDTRAMPNDPFQDPAGESDSTSSSMDQTSVLTVDRNATLTLGTDSLIVLDEGLRHERSASNFCGFFPQLSKTTRAIPFHNILYAEFNHFNITISHAKPVGRKNTACRPQLINYTVTDKSAHAHARQWVERLMSRAYPRNIPRRRRIKVLVNPFGGQGYAQKLWVKEIEPILAAARCEIDVERTKYRGHAVEIAQNLDIEAYDVVACASGDGLPHEVFNGLAKHASPKRALRKIAVVQLPCGSGNALSLNTTGTVSPSLAALELIKAASTPLDLVAVTQGNQQYYSFLSQAVGIIAESDLGTESLRWMGPFRFTWGILVRILGKTIYPAEISVISETSDKTAIKEAYCAATRDLASDLPSQQQQQAEPEPPLPSPSDTALPRLRYGTVNSPLSAEFTTSDYPNMGNFYVGNMCWMSSDAPFFTASLPSDGKMDMITIPGDIPRITALRMLSYVDQGTLINFPEVTYQKVLAYRITPRAKEVETRRRLRTRLSNWLAGAGRQKEGLIAMDGESVPFEPFQAEVIPKLATTLCRYGPSYGFDGKKLL